MNASAAVLLSEELWVITMSSPPTTEIEPPGAGGHRRGRAGSRGTGSAKIGNIQGPSRIVA